MKTITSTFLFIFLIFNVYVDIDDLNQNGFQDNKVLPTIQQVVCWHFYLNELNI